MYGREAAEELEHQRQCGRAERLIEEVLAALDDRGRRAVCAHFEWRKTQPSLQGNPFLFQQLQAQQPIHGGAGLFPGIGGFFG
jgi:hypothetical protein